MVGIDEAERLKALAAAGGVARLRLAATTAPTSDAHARRHASRSER